MKQTSGKKFPKRGEIYWTNLDPTIGGETKKRRPGLIVSNDLGNESSSVVMVAPISSKIKDKIYPFEVQFILNGMPSKIMLNQCRALDKSRLEQRMDIIDQLTMDAVEDAIRVVFGLN